MSFSINGFEKKNFGTASAKFSQTFQINWEHPFQKITFSLWFLNLLRPLTPLSGISATMSVDKKCWGGAPLSPSISHFTFRFLGVPIMSPNFQNFCSYIVIFSIFYVYSDYGLYSLYFLYFAKWTYPPIERYCIFDRQRQNIVFVLLSFKMAATRRLQKVRKFRLFSTKTVIILPSV